MKRSSGILMAVSSLPSPYGIGTLGKAAYDFADFLKDAGQSYWQMLPLGPTSYGDSPYQSFSAYAGNPYYIDPDMLAADGLLTAAECAAWGYEQVATLPELFRRSDFVNVSITLCDATRDLINAPVFAAANPELLLVNTSRGGIVNEHDLYVALTTGQIRAAASDVFVHEPPACDDPLIHLDNFIATFHIGGSTYESLERVSNRAVDYVFQYSGVAER